MNLFTMNITIALLQWGFFDSLIIPAGMDFVHSTDLSSEKKHRTPIPLIYGDRGAFAETRQYVAVMPHHRMRLSVFFSMKEPMVWKSCTMTTIRATVTSITGVL